MAGYPWKSRPCSRGIPRAASTRPGASTARQPSPILSKNSRTPEGVHAIEEAIIAGVPINVTLLFSLKQYEAAAEAYLSGIERRIALGLDPKIHSVASLFISRWDKAVLDKVPTDLHNRLGISVGAQAYRSYRAMLASPRKR